MTVTTEESWDVDDVPLNTYAWNISTQTGRLATPEPRGENELIPFRNGRVWRPKYVDQRVITLSMWVAGCTDDGGVPAAGTSQRAQFNANLDRLTKMFFTNSRLRLLDVKKRWRMPSGLKTATAQCELAGAITPEMTGNTRATFSVDLLIPNVYFFGEQQIVQVASGATVAIENDGDDATARWMKVWFRGPLTNPALKNTSPDPDHLLSLGLTINAGKFVAVDSWHMTAGLHDEASLAYESSVIGAVTRSGARPFFTLHPGTNTVNLTASSGTGRADLIYQIPYL